VHYYRKNIGDYAKKAGRLSILQHGVYNLLIDACYDRECFPTLDEAIDWVWASSKEEIEAVGFVLRKFFSMDSDGKFMQKRIEEEVQAYHGLCLANTKNGEKGGRPKGATKKTHSVNKKTHSVNKKSEPNPTASNKNPKPLTTNHKPITIKRFDHPTVDHFEIFWSSGMRKIGKKTCAPLFNRKLKASKLPPEEFTAKLCADIRNRITVDQLGFSQMHPSTYLNGERWEDEVRGQTPTRQTAEPDYAAISQNFKEL